MSHDAFSGCHPLVNFLFFVGAIGFGVVFQHPAYVAVGCLCAGAYYLLLKGRQGWKLIFGMLPLVFFVAAVNPLFNTDGDTVLFTVFDKPYTLQALLYGLAVGGIFLVTVLWFGCYSQVLTGDKFISLFGRVIPSLSLLLVMVLRMIPSLQRKAKQILDARKAIGKGVSKDCGYRQSVKGSVRALSALTDWSLEGGIVTADSMRARGYGTANRTGFQIYRMTGTNLLLLFAMVLLALAVLFLDNKEVTFTPKLAMETPGWGLVAYGIFLLIPVILHSVDALQWYRAVSKMPAGRDCK